jgi:cell division protein ZapA
MATVAVMVNGRAYSVGCEDGQEAHVEALAVEFDRQVQDVADQVGQVGELRLFLMAALMSIDELADLRIRLEDAEAAHREVLAARAADKARAADALNEAARRIDGMLKPEEIGAAPLETWTRDA